MHPPRRPPRTFARRALGASALAIGAMTGCAGTGVNEALRAEMARGAYATARVDAAQTIAEDPADRDYLLGRVRLLAAAMADGTDRLIETEIAELYDLLRTQGLNADRTAASLVVGERNARLWKGEPFEQALAYFYIGLHDAMDGDWGNARAAARNALFLLRDFERSGPALTDDPLAQRAALLEAEGEAPDESALAYTPVVSDFEAGYLLLALAAREAGYPEEVDEALRTLSTIAPELTDGADSVGGLIRRGAYDMVVVASYGLAPEKTRAGPDGAIGLFRARTPSDRARLVTRVVNGAETIARAPVATDINRMSEDLRWTSLEELRVARAQIGNALIAGGLITAGVGSGENEDTIALIGLGVAGLGALLASNAGADVRHAETLPQRLYLAPVALAPGAERVEVSIEGGGSASVSIPLDAVRGGLDPATGRGTPVVYVRLSEGVGRWAPTDARTLYANDASGVPSSFAQGPAWWGLPYVLGGRDVRTPTPSVMEDYWRAGVPRTVGVEDLRALYRDEGLVFGEAAGRDPTLRHVLEGGRGLYTPRGGSVGYLRLMTREAGAYAPRTEGVRALARASGAGVDG